MVAFTQRFVAGTEVQHLPDRAGLIFGRLNPHPRTLHTAPQTQPLRIGRQQAHDILRTQGRWLIDHTWGNYIALLNAPDTREHRVITSPCGELPCHLSRHEGVTLIFSDAQPLRTLKDLALGINDLYLESRLALGGIAPHAPLTGLLPIHRGECVTLGSEQKMSRTFYWHPVSWSSKATHINDVEAVAEDIRATVSVCTQALTAPHESLLLRLSGGLDSAIIAGCVRNHMPRQNLLAYTYYSATSRSRELRWASAVARFQNLAHLPCQTGPRDIPLQKIATIGALTEPTPTLLYILRSTLEQQLADSHGATAAITGDGGDSGFCGESYAYALVEHLQINGFSLRMFSLAAQIAALTQQTAWQVLHRSIKHWRRGTNLDEHLRMISSTSRLVHPDLLQHRRQQSHYPHPWFDQSATIPWPLIRRLGMLTCQPQPYNVECPERAPQVIAPLYSQPVIELLLGIPSYIHFLDGRERGLARRAFRQDIPPEIHQRRWKDRPNNILVELVDHNRTFLKEALLDGELMRRGLLLCGPLTTALSERPGSIDIHPMEILKLLDLEFWLRAWHR